MLFGSLKFPVEELEPRAKVGAVFEEVEQILEDNNIEGVFADKRICRYIADAVRPIMLRDRVKYHLGTEQGKEKAKSLRLLYKYLVGMYEKWYELHPTGFVESKAAAAKA